jgi:uncharacterized hydantoinase/oxoprolinase family protein
MAVTPNTDKEIGIVSNPCGDSAEQANWAANIRNLRKINSDITALDAGSGTTTTITIVSDVQLIAGTSCLEKKTRSIKVFSAGTESGWTAAGCP